MYVINCCRTGLCSNILIVHADSCRCRGRICIQDSRSRRRQTCLGPHTDSSQSGAISEKPVVWPAIQPLRHGPSKTQHLHLHPEAGLHKGISGDYLDVYSNPPGRQLCLSVCHLAGGVRAHF
jgi:hypothetical protein